MIIEKILKNQKKEIKILGAGISGMVAGITLAKNNYNVEIFEKRPNIGSYFKKGIHSIRNYMGQEDILSQYSEIGLDIKYAEPIFQELRFSPFLNVITIYSDKKPLFYNLIRGYTDERSLDYQLKHIAEYTGVKIYFNCDDTDYDLSKINIVATGAQNFQTYSGIAFGKQFRKKINPYNYYFLDNRYAPQGYVYLTPFQDEFSLVIATTEKHSRKNLGNKYRDLIQNNKIISDIIKDATYENDIFGIAYFDNTKTAIKNKRLYVGEAAGFLDASSGFGLNYAILSGYLAAKAIIENKNYDELWKKSFGNELESQCFQRMKLQKFDNREYEKSIGAIINRYGNKITADNYKKLKIK